ncbi:terminase small subunit [Tabrizicola sp. KVB23]|uniref:Terminase small subunit n=2 Tax=Fuscibacter oryzae TaxID=2803939 RepID=A0A8J7MTI5_9RHOB|nr:terminase small subunit [Fuscibacter oryzae]
MGVSLPTINAWVAKGCPIVEEGGRGRSWKLNTEAVRRWREDLVVEDSSGGDRDNMASLDRRLKMVQVEREELALAKDKGKVAPVEQFEQTMISVFAKVRAKMRMLPPRVALLLVGQTDEATIRAIMAREIDDALRDLGTVTLTDEDEG